jgi:GNAT superfamily N-acetyltransferase
MDIPEVDLAHRRTMMGTGAQGWVSSPSMFGSVGARSWSVLTGSLAPDMNMALIHSADPELLVEPLTQLAQRACPSLLMLAGAGKSLADQLPASFLAVGSMPIMAADLSSSPRASDPRVRRAGREDEATVTDLLAEAYGFDREVAALATAPLLAEGSTVMSIWLLEVGGEAVSTVTTIRVEDSVSVWCMGTPQRFGRRGYGKAILASVLDTAREDGAVLGLLGATPAGLPLYEATGWQTQETWDLFTDATSAQFSLNLRPEQGT